MKTRSWSVFGSKKSLDPDPDLHIAQLYMVIFKRRRCIVHSEAMVIETIRRKKHVERVKL